MSKSCRNCAHFHPNAPTAVSDEATLDERAHILLSNRSGWCWRYPESICKVEDYVCGEWKRGRLLS